MWKRLVAALALLVPWPAHAAFHLWDIVEVFSNEDGSVQYVEMFTSGTTERFLSNHALRTRQETVVLETFTIPSDLAGSTSNRSLLFATPGFETVAGIAPDFTIPAGFIEVGVADELAFETVSFFALAGLPTDGIGALYVGGVVDAPSPTNFAGETGTIVPEPIAAAAGGAALGSLLLLRRRRSRGV